MPNQSDNGLSPYRAQLGPRAAGDCPGARESQLGDRMSMGSKSPDQNTKIEGGVVGDEVVIAKPLGDLRPEFTEFGFVTHLLGGDSMDLNIRSVKVQRPGSDQPANPVNNLASADRCQPQLTGAVVSPARGFEIDCGEIRGKIHDFLDPHPQANRSPDPSFESSTASLS